MSADQPGGGLSSFVKGLATSNECGTANPISSLVSRVGPQRGARGMGALPFMHDRWQRVPVRPSTEPVTGCDFVPILTLSRLFQYLMSNFQRYLRILFTALLEEYQWGGLLPFSVFTNLIRLGIPNPGIPLEGQERIMRRSEVLAKHMCPDAPPEFVVGQVCCILARIFNFLAGGFNAKHVAY